MMEMMGKNLLKMEISARVAGVNGRKKRDKAKEEKQRMSRSLGVVMVFLPQIMQSVDSTTWMLLMKTRFCFSEYMFSEEVTTRVVSIFAVLCGRADVQAKLSRILADKTRHWTCYINDVAEYISLLLRKCHGTNTQNNLTLYYRIMFLDFHVKLLRELMRKV